MHIHDQLSANTANKYAKGSAFHIDVLAMLMSEFNLDNLYKVTDLTLLEQIRVKTTSLDIDKNGNRQYSAAITKYKKFIEYLNNMENSKTPTLLLQCSKMKQFTLKVMQFFQNSELWTNGTQFLPENIKENNYQRGRNHLYVLPQSAGPCQCH